MIPSINDTVKFNDAWINSPNSSQLFERCKGKIFKVSNVIFNHRIRSAPSYYHINFENSYVSIDLNEDGLYYNSFGDLLNIFPLEILSERDYNNKG